METCDLQTTGNAVADAINVARKIVPPQVYDILTFCGTLLCVVLFVCFPLRRTVVRITKKLGSLVVRIGRGQESTLYTALKKLVQHENAQLEVSSHDGWRILKSGLLVVSMPSKQTKDGVPVAIVLDNVQMGGILTPKEYGKLLSVAQAQAEKILQRENKARREWQAFKAQEVLRDVDNGLHGGTSKIGPIRRA